ncbi:DUF6708 domain-containing protein [Entomomonas asaccharolytica]|uniref:Uncharacterized protein n=1 Tax=Entomomonas asaccharolytica TaxID=2785331 RepID=A0A974NDQ5_9GAMM|nr:DUF6708 domain-containing protein [Entomomonas asaccharolytica]QQP84796.1 hypothetical protein JHT90_10330 [Entomomonas asaccharolytica]
MANNPTQLGEQQTKLLSQSYGIAPPPVPTNQLAIPQQLDIENATNTYIDYGKADYWGFQFGSRLCFGNLSILTIPVLFTHLVVIYYYYTKKSFGIWEAIKIGTIESWFLYPLIVGGMALLLLVLSVYSWAQKNNQVPIRFNREKRQVYCILPSGRNIIANWEQIQATISRKQQVTMYYAIEGAALTLGFPDLKSQEQGELTMDYPMEQLAIGEWEAIRVYMEEGLDALNKKTKTAAALNKDSIKLEDLPKDSFEYYEQLSFQYPEGSVPYFYAVKNRVRKEGKPLNYLWWLIIHICSAWTLPCYIATWLNKHPKIVRPLPLLNWSKPIPPEQWVKPTEELKKQSQRAQSAYLKGLTIKDYAEQYKQQ